VAFIRVVANTLLATVGGSLAGGVAGGATVALISNFPDFSNAASVWSALGGFAIYLGALVLMATLGAVGGLMFGFIPTLLLGSLLSLARNLWPFGHLPVWAIAGALAGFAVYFWTPYGSPSVAHDRMAWASAWAVGGAISMSVYWASGIGRRAPFASPSAAAKLAR
jgi:hypothetical protein